jgi:cyclophilin family peptidyl-prolyl cis-trans isomerase
MKTPYLLFIGALCYAILGSSSGCQPQRSPLAELPQEENMVTTETVKDMPDNSNAQVKITTKFGDMIVQLYDETPLHRDNFLKLVDEGYYNDLIFHRVIKNFMIQGGDPDSRGAAPNARLGAGGPGYTIPAEFNNAFTHKKGALAAARQGDQVNPKRASSGSQFYIVQGAPVQEAMLLNLEMRRNYGKDSTNQFHYTPEDIEFFKTQGGTPHLDGEYTVFGEIIEGLSIVDSIGAVRTMPGDRPVEDVIMKMERVKK